jgi:serine/threonine protein kinase
MLGGRSTRKRELELFVLMRAGRHPHCVLVLDIIDEPSCTHVVMEHLSGGTVMERMTRDTAFDENTCCRVASHVFMALEFMHAQGLVHRDLKLENLLFVSDDPQHPDYEKVKVTDFNLANVTGDSATLRTVCGSPLYLAPEVVLLYTTRNKSECYGEAVDMWAMGVLLYTMCVAFPPFSDDNTSKLFAKIVKGEYSMPSPYFDGISDNAKDLIRSLLVVAPEKRLEASEALRHVWITDSTQHGHKYSNHAMHSQHRAFMCILNVPLFGDFGALLLQRLAAMLTEVRVPQGQDIIRVGDTGDSMYIINHGAVKVTLACGKVLDRLFSGQFFGELAITVESRRGATVTAIGSQLTAAAKRASRAGSCSCSQTGHALQHALQHALAAPAAAHTGDKDASSTETQRFKEVLRNAGSNAGLIFTDAAHRVFEAPPSVVPSSVGSGMCVCVCVCVCERERERERERALCVCFVCVCVREREREKERERGRSFVCVCVYVCVCVHTHMYTISMCRRGGWEEGWGVGFAKV